MSDPDEGPESEQRNLYHQEREREFEPAFGDSENIERITAHITKYIGDPSEVFHEFVSDMVHLDVHVVKPRPDRDFYTLITTGMSDRPMTPHPEEAEFKYAELMLCLPPDWPLAEEGHQWPIELLKFLARMPHEYQTWVAEAHTMPNGDPPEEFPGTTMSAVLFVSPQTAADEFVMLKVNDEKTIYFWAVILLYPEELKLKLKKGAEALFELLNQHNITELIDPKRPNTVKKRFGLF